jgi:DNA-binding SARP family transcriptional activator
LRQSCSELGKTLGPRIYVTGQVTIEHGDTLVGERQLAGRQGRLAFAYLVLRRSNAVTRDALVDVLWPDAPPPELESAISAILSKLRSAMKLAGLTAAGIDVHLGALRLRLPADARVDVEEAANAIDESEGAWRQRDVKRAWAHANVAAAVARRPFLAREEAGWIESERARLRAVLSRSLHVLSAVSAENNEPALAVQYANEIVALEPFRETSYQHLMRLHAAMGNRGEALRVFGQLRELLRDELGTTPSPQTEAVFREIVTAT